MSEDLTPRPPAEDRRRSIREIMAVNNPRSALPAHEDAPESTNADEMAPDLGDDPNGVEVTVQVDREGHMGEAVVSDRPSHFSDRMSRSQIDYSARRIARICHEANRAYSAVQGDTSHEAWGRSPQWVIDSAVDGVRKIITGEITSPQQSHEAWLAYKRADGWVHGPVKDPVKKTHPSLLEYAALPPREKVKDHLFHAIVTALVPELQDAREEQLDNVYTERNAVVAAFARMARLVGWRVGLTKTDIPGWNPAWHNCLFVETPEGQLSWHFHDREVDLFTDLPQDPDLRWDGHTTGEKYRRLDDVARLSPPPIGHEYDYSALKLMAHLLSIDLRNNPWKRVQELQALIANPPVAP